MDDLLIPVSMLETKLGRGLGTVDSVDYKRAQQTIWEISVQARSVADKTVTDWPDHTSPDLPDQVKVIVAAASYRAFKNPNRYVMNQALDMTGQLDPYDFRGDVFLKAERDALESYRTNAGMWVQETTRAYPSVRGREYSLPLTNGGKSIVIGDENL